MALIAAVDQDGPDMLLEIVQLIACRRLIRSSRETEPGADQHQQRNLPAPAGAASPMKGTYHVRFSSAIEY
jgi:hypothetical protein